MSIDVKRTTPSWSCPARTRKTGQGPLVDPEARKVVVERSTWPPATRSPAVRAGGRHHPEGDPLLACKVMTVCPKCNKATRVAHKVEGGKKVRVCKHCGAEI